MTQGQSDVIANGLPKTDNPQRVIVVGAGMAGLVAACELLRAGHDPIILEARPRVGGRVWTLREPFSDGLYAELGAMRIPRSHDLTMAYVEKFKLATAPFTMGNPRCFYHLHGKRYRIADVQTDPNCLGFDLADAERGKTHDQLWAAAIDPLIRRLDRDGDAAWQEIVAEYDQFSTREFLEHSGWSEAAIEM